MTDIRPNMVECSTRQLWSVEDHCDPSDPSSIIASSSSLDHHHWLQAWSDLPASPHVSSKMAAVNALIHTDNHSTTTTTTPSSSPAAVSAANSDVTADTMTSSSSSATVIGHGRGRPTNGRSLMSVFGSEPTNNHSTTAAVLMKHSPSEGATHTHVLGSRLHALTISNGVSRSVANHTAVNRSAAKLPGNTEVRVQRRPLHLSNRLSPALTPPIIVPPPHRHLPPATSLQQEMAELDRQRLLNNGMHVLSHHAYLASLATQQQHSQLQAGVVGSAVATGFQGLPYMATAPSTAQEQYFIAGMYPGAATAAMYPASAPAFYGLPYMFPSATTAGLMVSSCHQPQHLSQSSSVASPADSPCSLLSADSSHCPVPPPPPTTNPHLPLVSFSAAFGDATANSELAAAAVNGCAGVSASSCSSSSTCSSMLSAAELAAVSSSGVCAPSYPPACLLPPPAALLTAPPPSCLARRAVGSDRRAAAGRLGSVLLDSLRGLHDSGDEGQLQLAQLVGHLRPLAQDQHGSRFIQQRLQQATAAEKQLVFGELLAAVPSLITDVFGNYVVQKLLEFGSPEQRVVLAQLLVGRVVSLSTHMYGCRVVQKALEMTGDEQRTALACELRGHVTRCVRDQNGNHVVQKCIECVCDSSVRQFVVDAFVGHARQLAAHPYGCRVIQRLLEHCERQQTRPLLDELHVSCGALLADQYGNYVIQHVVQHGPAADRTRVINQLLSGQLAALCQHKFASNVVEKAVIYGECQQRAALVDQLCILTDSVMLAVLKDQFGNYVVQKMLDTAESPQRCRLIAHIQPHVASLKRYTFGKHILAKLEKCSTGERVVSAVSPLSASVSTAAGDTVDCLANGNV